MGFFFEDMNRMKFKTYLRFGKRIYACDRILDYRRRYVFYMRCLLNAAIIKKHCDFFEQSFLRKKMLSRTPHFLDQVLRYVFYKNSTAESRSEIVQKHLLVMEETFKKKLLDLLYVKKQQVILWQDEYKGKPLVLYLTFREGQQKEGCLALELVYDSLDVQNTGWEYGTHVYQIIFSLGKDEKGKNSMMIGALQGLANGKDFIRDLTKAYFGYRPKNLIFWCARCFCEMLGVEKIYAVSNQGHYAMNHYRVNRKLKVNMDEFWQECGGRQEEDKRFYEIPLVEKRKDMRDLKPPKRALHRRRFVKMDEIREEIRRNLRRFMREKEI